MQELNPKNLKSEMLIRPGVGVTSVLAFGLDSWPPAFLPSLEMN